MKTCSRCKKERSIKEFYAKPGGHVSHCKQCRREHNARYYLSKREQKIRQAREYVVANKEKVYERQKRYRAKNKEAIKAKQKKYYEENREALNRRSREYHQEHTEELKQAGKEYSKRPLVAERRREYMRNYEKQRKQSDQSYRLSRVFRVRVREALAGRCKHFNTSELIGCSVEELKKHIESQFEPGMTWKNHTFRGWHLDHRIPCASFDLSIPEQQKQCFHYSNLQPLWAGDNLRKWAKVA
jgi:hypothetical protein